MRFLLVILILSVAFVTAADQITIEEEKSFVLSTIAGHLSDSMKWLFDNSMRILEVLQDPDSVDQRRCYHSMGIYLQQLIHGKSWALAMLDSSGKLQSGIMYGNRYSFGEYDECLEIDPRPTYNFTGMHCLADLHIKIPEDMIIVMPDGKERYVSVLLGGHDLVFSVGQCFPSTCKPWIVQDLYNKLLTLPNVLPIPFSFEVTVRDSDCSVANKTLPITTPEWIFVLVTILILFLVMLSTAADYFYVRKKTLGGRSLNRVEQLMISFSILTNGQKLARMKIAPGSISAINGMKFLSIVWIITCHRYRPVAKSPTTNASDTFMKSLTQWSKMLIFSGPLAVDTFFTISGALNMYSFCGLRSKNEHYSLIEIIQSYIHRFVRLTPPYAYIIAFSTTWWYRCGDGPMWDRVVGREVQRCKDEWWSNILYVNNYVNTNPCLLQSWYLSVDMQLFWVAPILMYPLWKWPMFGLFQIIVFLAASVASPIAVAYNNEIYIPIPITANDDRLNFEMETLYYPTHTKASSYILGILTGYILYQVKFDQLRIRFSKVANSIAWLLASGFMLFALFGGHDLYQENHIPNRIQSALYIGFQKFFWGLGISWMLIACVTGYAGPINKFLSWEGFNPLGKLTFGIYLTHVAILQVSLGMQRDTITHMDFKLVETILGETVLATLFAIPLSLCLEAPILALEKVVFGSRSLKTEDDEKPSTSKGHKGGYNHNY